MSRAVSADPREPSTVENRTKTGVSTPSPRKAGAADAVGGAVADEDAVRGGAAGVHDPLGDALVVEVRDLLAEVVVLEQGRARARRPCSEWSVSRTRRP